MPHRSILIRRDHFRQLTDSLEKLIASRESALDRWALGELSAALARARVVDQMPEKPQVITIGTTVRIVNLFNNEEFIYTLVMPEAANAEQGRLSVTDPVGAVLLGYREGDIIPFAPFRNALALKVLEVIDHPIEVVAGPGKRLIPMLYSRVTGCPGDLIDFYVSLFSGQKEAQVLPHHLGNMEIKPAEFVRRMDAFLEQIQENNECPVMIVEWQWHSNMTRMMALLHKRKQETLFVKTGGSQPVRRVTALISGSRHSMRNLKIASSIAAHLGVPVTAVRVIDPSWIGLKGERAKGEYVEMVREAMEANLNRSGLGMPVRVLFSDNVAAEVARNGSADELLVMGCPNDLLIHNGFMKSQAGEILRRFAGTVLMRLPGAQAGKPLDLGDVFWEATIVRDLEARDKWGAIERLIGALTRVGQIPPERHDHILQAIQLRELDGSTEVGGGIAMPHAAIDDFDGVVGCLGISPTGINYEEGADPVHFVFLLISSSRDYAKYHEIQAAIARFMTKKAELRRKRLLRCQTPAEVARALGAGTREKQIVALV